MKLRFAKFIISGLLVGGLLTACNKNSSDDEDDTSLADVGSASTIVTGFSLKSNYKLLVGLDSVFFSIDQVKAHIFNADSLPEGTDVRKLQVTISAPSSAKSVEIIMPSRYDGQDTIINYLKNPNDSINFSRGSVMLRVSSASGLEERVYTVNVNVHKVNADSLQWNAQNSRLQSDLSPRPIEEKSVQLGDTYFTLTRNAAGDACMATSASPLFGSWTFAPAALPADARIETLAATSDALYIIGGEKLYRSTNGLTWTDTETDGWTWLYGGYDTDIIGAKGTDRWAAYPSTSLEGEIPSGMPVRGTSTLWAYSDDWFIAPQAMFIGGIAADGTYCGDTWGFDGANWGQLSSRNALPEAEGFVLFPYFTYRSGNNKFYIITKYSCWIALGGKTADGMNNKVYISLDNGVNWREASQSMQLPEAISPRSGASIMLADKTFNSRATAPITSWDAPFILLSGGYSRDGSLYDQLWTGVLNRLTFKPLQ